MKTKYLLISGVILILILGGWYTFNKVTSTEVTSTKQGEVQTATPIEKASFNYKCDEGKTAFDVLDEKAEVEFTESSFGKLVTSIDGKSQGDGKYWLYSIDDKEATMGATAYICNGNEKIKWELK